MKDFENDIDNCLATLKQGGLILYPTDTIWGIGCDATNEEAVEKIFSLKKRPEEKSMIILVSGKEEIMHYVALPDLAIFDFLETTVKPTTVIYEHAKGIASNCISKDGSIAIRICTDKFCQALIKRFGKPIVSTSANISGTDTPASFPEIGETVKAGVDYIVQYRQEDIPATAASAVIKWNKDGSFTVIRP